MSEFHPAGDPRFVPLVEALLARQTPLNADFRVQDDRTVFGLWPDLTLAWTNAGWWRFAAENDGEPAVSQRWNIGCHVLESVAGPLRDFFEEQYARCLSEMHPWEHDYDCSTPERYRLLSLLVYPLGDAEGLLAFNSVRIEGEHADPACEPLESVYRTETGLVTQCSHCRRFRRAAAPQTWDRVPEWIRHPPDRVSHGLCETCFAFYYDTATRDRIRFGHPWSAPPPEFS